MDRAWLNLGPTLMILGLMSAEGPHFFTLAVPGNHSVGPYDPVTAPYGRRGHGRLRRPTHAYPRQGKRVKRSKARRARRSLASLIQVVTEWVGTRAP